MPIKLVGSLRQLPLVYQFAAAENVGLRRVLSAGISHDYASARSSAYFSSNSASVSELDRFPLLICQSVFSKSILVPRIRKQAVGRLVQAHEVADFSHEPGMRGSVASVLQLVKRSERLT